MGADRGRRRCLGRDEDEGGCLRASLKGAAGQAVQVRLEVIAELDGVTGECLWRCVASGLEIEAEVGVVGVEANAQP